VEERSQQIDALRREALQIEKRLGELDTRTARNAKLASDLESVRQRIIGLERAEAEDAHRINTLEERLRSLLEEQSVDRARLDRIEKALGIGPEPSP